jgi:hypothetical protein
MRKMMLKAKGLRKMQFQRNDLKLEFPVGLEELSPEETKSIVAGESAAYWIGYFAGKIANIFS